MKLCPLLRLKIQKEVDHEVNPKISATAWLRADYGYFRMDDKDIISDESIIKKIVEVKTP